MLSVPQTSAGPDGDIWNFRDLYSSLFIPAVSLTCRAGHIDFTGLLCWNCLLTEKTLLLLLNTLQSEFSKV